jgi:cytoskeletal protein CcmA (bactofilin family)
MAARFWIGGGTNTNWNASPTTNWAATSGGAVRVAAPTVADDVTFDGAGAGNSASVVSAANSCLSLTFTAGYTNTITINTAIVLTVAGNFTDNTAHTWVVSGTGSMTISASSTIASGGKTFPGPVTFSGAAATKTISGNWTITGALTVATNAQIINHTVAETITSGGMIFNVATSGTIDIIVTTGTVNSGAAITIASLTFAGGTITIGNLQWSSGNITYTSGTVTQSGGSTLTAGTGTYNTAGVSWSTLSFNAGSTITITSLMTATTMALGLVSGVTFAGSAGWTVGTFTDAQTAAQTITLKNGITYTITTSFTCNLSRVGTPVVFTSDDGTLKANLTLTRGASCNVLANFTRIDASGGRIIRTFNSTVTTCTNIVSFTDILTAATIY